ncbi:MAG: UDP-N-acetylmuramoyl-L-alanine--D-glutamate ligase [Acidimicrobiales bacterium]
MTTTLVAGVGVQGQAVSAALLDHGESVIAADDAPSADALAVLARRGVAVHAAPDGSEWDRLVAGADQVVPSPGLPENHPVFAAAGRHGTPIRSELDLAGDWDQRPIVAVTGTNGKTTVTTMLTACLEAAGQRAVAAGNTDLPLVTAIADPAVDVFVVEASSFQLARTERFTPRVAVWLNFAPDHLDLHRSVDSYRSAKERIFRDLDATSVAVVNLDDPVVALAETGSARRVSFGLEAGEWTLRDGYLTGPAGPAMPVADLQRRLPHDIANALAVLACADALHLSADTIALVLAGFSGLPHRVACVGEDDGVRWYDDSKATTPHATVAALDGFDSVVLIAGGRNKGVDLTPLRHDSVRAVVAIGDAAAEVEAVFADSVDTVVATSMHDAVTAAAKLAHPGDAVLLSPACASFDWYRSYAERGDDFTREVQQLTGAEA